MSYVTPTSTPTPPGVVGELIRQPSAPTIYEPSKAAPSRVVDLTELSESHEMAAAQGTPVNDANDPYSVPRHHNEGSLCCPHGSSYEVAVSCVTALPCCWPCWCSTCNVLSNRDEAAIYLQGQPYAHVSSPVQKWLCVNPCMDVQTFSKNQSMINLDEVKAADADGSPIVLSGVVTYTIGDPWHYFAAGNVTEWVHNQGLVVMKEVASRYPYDACQGEVSLRTRGSRNVVVQSLKNEMQQRVRNIGLTIKSFEFTDMHYAKEVAAQMLVTQQAKATLNARRLIVDGAVGIVAETVGRLEGLGVHFTPQQKADLVRSLLVMSVSDAPAQTTIAV